MHSKKILAVLALLLTACLLGTLFAGCSEKPAEDSSQATGESTAQNAGDGQTYATVDDLLSHDDICEQYKSSAQTIWGTGGMEVAIDVYAQDDRVVFSYVIPYSSDVLDIATMRSNMTESMDKWVIICNTISSGIERVVETPGTGLRVEILTSDGVQLFNGDYAGQETEE